MESKQNKRKTKVLRNQKKKNKAKTTDKIQRNEGKTNLPRN